jgi:nucleotide-binding universal stress UspA family protein
LTILTARPEFRHLHQGSTRVFLWHSTTANSFIMKKLLVPTDFSKTADAALEVAVSIAHQIGASITLIHINELVGPVIPVSELHFAIDQELRERYVDSIRVNLKKMLEKLSAKFDDITIEQRVQEGIFATSLLELARVEHFDMIVMGTKGATGLKEFFVGSNTEKIVRFAPCPVLAIPNKQRTKFKDILVATSLDDDQGNIFEQLKEWHGLFSKKAYLLNVNSPEAYAHDERFKADEPGLEAAAGLDFELIRTPGFTLNEELAIFEQAEEKEVDLIVMGTHQRKGLMHLLVGSLTEDVINHSELPILAIPLGQAE